MASMGVGHSRELQPRQLRRRIGHMDTRSYAELFDSLAAGELLAIRPVRDAGLERHRSRPFRGCSGANGWAAA